jgi:hypothetical protein
MMAFLRFAGVLTLLVGCSGGASSGGDPAGAPGRGAGGGAAGESGQAGAGGGVGDSPDGGLLADAAVGGSAGAAVGGSAGAAVGGAAACPGVPSGCGGAAPSFSAEVAPLLHQACGPCHLAGGVESKRLLTDYAHVQPQRGAILSQLAACLMPPSDAPPLTVTERELLLQWLVCGAPGP